MKAQHSNKIMSSFLLWADSTLMRKGEAYTNVSGNFYPINQNFNGLYTYAAPYKQLIFDSSVSGANVITGLYLNNNFIGVGTNGLSGINYNEGQVYFTSGVGAGTISGNYSIKDFNVALTSRTDGELIFETKYVPRPRTVQTLTGLQSDQIAYPIIYIRQENTQNTPVAFGGFDCIKINARAVVISDSLFKLDAVFSIFRDQARTLVPILEESDFPLNSLGGLKNNTAFNYSGLAALKNGVDETFFIRDVYAFTLSNAKSSSITYELQKLNPNLHVGIINFELEDWRYPRS